MLATATVGADGSWTAALEEDLAEGLNTLSVIATDEAGVEGDPTSIEITVDTTAPEEPTAALAPGVASNPTEAFTTADPTPTLAGEGSAGDTVTVRAADGTELATATVRANGKWSVTLTEALPRARTSCWSRRLMPLAMSAAASVTVTVDTSDGEIDADPDPLDDPEAEVFTTNLEITATNRQAIDTRVFAGSVAASVGGSFGGSLSGAGALPSTGSIPTRWPRFATPRRRWMTTARRPTRPMTCRPSLGSRSMAMSPSPQPTMRASPHR